MGEIEFTQITISNAWVIISFSHWTDARSVGTDYANLLLNARNCNCNFNVAADITSIDWEHKEVCDECSSFKRIHRHENFFLNYRYSNNFTHRLRISVDLRSSSSSASSSSSSALRENRTIFSYIIRSNIPDKLYRHKIWIVIFFRSET